MTSFCNYTFCQGKENKETLFVAPYGVEQGLRQSMVSHVIQDKTGLIWLTTGDGLHYFDGNEFRVFRVPVNDVYSHSDNLLRDITERKPGFLILSSSSSILSFDISRGQFNIVYRKEGCYPVLLDLSIDQHPVAWLPDKKLCIILKDRIIPRPLIFSNNNLPPLNFSPKNVVRLKSGELLISDNDGIIILDNNRRVNGSSFRAVWMPVAGCQAVAVDRTGRAFILAQGKLYEYKGKGEITLFFDTGIRDKMNLFIDSEGNFWLTGRENNKQFKLSDGHLKELRFLSFDGKHADSIFPDIRSVFEDNYHNLWFGTDNNGALVYSPGKMQLLRADIGFTRCMAWFNDEIWAGTYNTGLWRISPDLSRARQVHLEYGKKEVYYLDLAVDRKGRLWVATRHGLEVLDPRGNSLLHKAFICKSAKLIICRGDSVMEVCDGQLYHYISGDKVSFLGSEKFVSVSSFLSTDDAFWVGNQFGLYRSKKSSGFNRDLFFDARYRISANPVYSLLFFEGCTWSATGNGIEIFYPGGKRKPVPDFIKELQNEVIYSLLSDDHGRIWFTGNRGIGCIDVKKNRIFYFSSRNNLQSLEFNYNAACSSPDGKLYFGGIRGINGFDPAWSDMIKKPPETRLLSLSVADTDYTKGIPPGYAEIKLNRQAPHISGKVFCSDYTNAGSQLFSFYLEGYQLGWGKPTQDADFNYRDLPPGEYRLLVKCADSWQNWSEPVTVLSVKLKPPVWKTGWFLFVLISVIITSTALLVKKINSIRYNQRIQHLKQQYAIEKERLRISKDMHDEIGASLTRISILSELAKNQKDDREAEMKVISQISEIAGGVVDEMSEIIWAMNPKNDNLENFTSYFRQYASSYLETAAINTTFSFPGEVPSISLSSEFRRNIFLTLKEALHNVVKHSGAGHVSVQMSTDRILKIVIRDDGKGFIIEKTSGHGNGLKNMRKRVEEQGGLFTVTSEPGKGTTIQLSVHFPADDKSH